MGWLLTHYNLRENGRAEESFRKAYELRSRASEWEKLAIESRYYHSLIGDLISAHRTTELWAQNYPRDGLPLSIMSEIDYKLGQYEKALAEGRECARLDPGIVENLSNLTFVYVSLNRVQEARALVEGALKDKFDDPDLHEAHYAIDFLEASSAGMAQQMAWSAGKPGVESLFLAIEADTAAYSGQLTKAPTFPAKPYLPPRPLRSRKPRQDSKRQLPSVKPSSATRPKLSSALPRRWSWQRAPHFAPHPLHGVFDNVAPDARGSRGQRNPC